jgi:hypothetical protein
VFAKTKTGMMKDVFGGKAEKKRKVHHKEMALSYLKNSQHNCLKKN